MFTRRNIIASGCYLSLAVLLKDNLTYASSDSSFEALLKTATEEDEEHPSAQNWARQERVKILLENTKAITPRHKKSDRLISKRAIDLIVFCEVSSQLRYEKCYQKPIWPKGNSGITIGIGYDLGYVNKTDFNNDWSGKTLLPDDDILTLEKACGLKGKTAKETLANFQCITIPWQKAYDQFTSNLLPFYIGETERALPNTSQLSGDSLGALVSLVYNRGPGFKNGKEKYQEMNNIYDLMEAEQFSKIPAEIIKMKRLWQGNPDMAGVLVRRDLEAALFTDGLKLKKTT